MTSLSTPVNAPKPCPKCGAVNRFAHLQVNALGQLEYICPDCKTVLGVKKTPSSK